MNDANTDPYFIEIGYLLNKWGKIRSLRAARPITNLSPPARLVPLSRKESKNE